MIVLHAFNENPGEGQELHMKYWYGAARPSDIEQEDPAHPVVCWCGAKGQMLDKNTCVVWHADFWPTMFTAKEIPND